ncbi:MAG: hypothetical protein QOD45_604, partial [Pseudonocardiales bacterium]|nr:hypothetical protein [Pseudonocardiales bacterium]
MSSVKEPGYFSPDVSVPTRWNRDLDAYLELFAAAGDMPVRGESSPAYLYSEVAARQIAEVAPQARLLAIFRNPVDAIAAMYAEARKWGLEPERTVAAAVAAARRGRPDSARPGGVWLRYFDVLAYAEQLERYLDVFGR